MAVRRPPVGRKRTVTMAERLDALTAENQELQERLQKLTKAAEYNEAVLRKTQERELELLRADSLARLLERMIEGLKTSYQLDSTSLILHDPQHEIRHLLAGDGFLFENLPDVQLVDELTSMGPQLAKLERPWLGPYRPADHEALTILNKGIGSVALIPLRRNAQLDGVLVFGSVDRRRFHKDLASDFLAHLGVIAAVCVENAVNRARLLRSGMTDFLTGFHNRRYLQARLCEELARAQRAKQALAYLMIDVDHFKRINDQYGHLAGDAVLRAVAQRIDNEMRMSDTGARFGGDEFAIVVAQGNVEDGRKVAQRVLDAVRTASIPVKPELSEKITLSIGVAAALPKIEARDYQSIADRLIAEADAALYKAKGAGRNRVATSPRLVE